jgi:hypothetical protein
MFYSFGETPSRKAGERKERWHLGYEMQQKHDNNSKVSRSLSKPDSAWLSNYFCIHVKS